MKIDHNFELEQWPIRWAMEKELRCRFGAITGAIIGGTVLSAAAGVGIVAGGLAVGSAVNNYVNGGSGGGNININTAGGGGGGGGLTADQASQLVTAAQTQNQEAAVGNATLMNIDQNIVGQTNAIEEAQQQAADQTREQEYITLGLAAVSLAAALFMRRKGKS